MADICRSIDIIGGADGPTGIFVSGANPWEIAGAVLVVAAAVAIGVWHTKKK